MKKLQKLKDNLKNLQSAVLAFSGGVDSSFLLAAAYQTLGDKVLAVTATSPTYTKTELKQAKSFAQNLGARHLVIETQEFEDPNFVNNPPERCYYCKKELFTELKKIADQNGLKHVIDASNQDDLSDYRPGAIAKKELGVLSPMQEVGLTKEEIRRFSKEIGLQTWDQPALACLSSRFPYRTKITQENLTKIEQAEDFIRGFGFKNVRVRHHHEIARIEVPKEEMEKFNQAIADEITKELKKIGYIYVTLDLEGYRMGSMNETLGIS